MEVVRVSSLESKLIEIMLNLIASLSIWNLTKNVKNSCSLNLSALYNSISPLYTSIYVYIVRDGPQYPASYLATFQNVQQRLATFVRYRSSEAMSVTNLASSGYVYVGNGSSDEVRCVSCGAVVHGRGLGDDGGPVHRGIRPHCVRVNTERNYQAQANSPLIPQANMHGTLSLQNNMTIQGICSTQSVPPSSGGASSMLVCFPQRDDALNHRASTTTGNAQANSGTRHDKEFSHSKNSLLGTQPPLNSSDNLQHSTVLQASDHVDSPNTTHRRTVHVLGRHTTRVSAQESNIERKKGHKSPVQAPRTAQYPEQASMENRLFTLRGLSTFGLRRMEAFARSGLFPEDPSVICVCFYCGVRLSTTITDPLVEHVIVSAKCCYIQAVFGWKFVSAVLGLHAPGRKMTVFEVVELMRCEGQSPTNHLNAAIMRYMELLPQSPSGVIPDRIMGSVASLRQTAVGYVGAAYQDRDIDIGSSSGYSGGPLVSSHQNNVSSRRCMICWSEVIQVMFLECMHQVACKSCANLVRKCPQCSATITGESQLNPPPSP